jgi:hypothetical protein
VERGRSGGVWWGGGVVGAGVGSSSWYLWSEKLKYLSFIYVEVEKQMVVRIVFHLCSHNNNCWKIQNNDKNSNQWLWNYLVICFIINNNWSKRAYNVMNNFETKQLELFNNSEHSKITWIWIYSLQRCEISSESIACT